MNKVMRARQLRRAIQLWAASVSDESTMMEIADVYPKWSGSSLSYKAGDIVAFGENKDGETQLYRVIQAHISQDTWSPDVSGSLFAKIGFTESGDRIWTRPLGSEDAYSMGDIVFHGGSLWVSDSDGNVWEPGVYGWTAKEEQTWAKAL